MKKRIISIILSGILLVLMANIAMAAQQNANQKVIRWKIQSQHPAASLSFKALKNFMDNKVTKLTNGRLEVTVFPVGSLIPTEQIFGAVRKGTVEGGAILPYYYQSTIPLCAVASSLPMTFKDSKEALHLHFDLGLEKMMKDAHAKFNLLYYTDRLYSASLATKKPLHEIEDFKGYKIRATGLTAAMLKDIGASPVSISGGELYLSLSTGVINGVQWGGPAGMMALKLHEVAKYQIEPAVAIGADGIIINKEAFEALPKDIQTILDKAMIERAYERTQEVVVEDQEALKIMVKKYGVQVSVLSDACQKTMRLNAMKQWDQVASKDAASAKAIGILKNYLKTLHYID